MSLTFKTPITKILSSTAIALTATFTQAQEGNEEISCIQHETVVHRPAPRWQIGAETEPAIVDFDRIGPHYLRIMTNARSTANGNCRSAVDIVNTETGRVSTVWRSMGYGNPYIAEGQHILYAQDGIQYSFHIDYCNNRSRDWDRHTSITITRDLTNYDGLQCVNSKGMSNNIIALAENMIFDPVGDPYIVIIEDKTRAIGPGIERTDVYNITRSNTVSFEEAFNWGGTYGGGLSVGPLEFQSGAQMAWGDSSEVQFEQERSRGVEVTVSGNLCTKWQIQIYEKRQKYNISAPAFTGNTVVPMHVVIDTDMLVTPDSKLCPDTPSLEPLRNGPSAN